MNRQFQCTICAGSLIAWAVWASGLLIGAGAAEAAASQTGLRTEIFSISETRGARGRCNIGLGVTGEALGGAAAAILKVRVTRAVDDTGANLILPGSENQMEWAASGGLDVSPMRGSWYFGPYQMCSANLQLAATARSARHIADLEGELELLAPTFKNGGVVAIENFRLQPGKPLEETLLKKHRVTLTYLTKESYETAKAASSGTKGSHQRLRGMEDPVGHLFPGILNEPDGLRRNYVVFKLDDPQRRVAGFAFCEPGGRALPGVSRSAVDDMIGFYFNTVLPEGLSLRVYLAVPEALEKVPFSLKNIPLP